MDFAVEPIVNLERISFRYPGAPSDVIHDLSINVQPREFVAVVGGSGVGKSTILRVAAGLTKPDTGTVRINSIREHGRRRRAMVFQDGRLMPWRTVWANVGLGLEGLELTAAKSEKRISDALKTTGLSDLAGRWPHQLSGGQLQRVDIARALAVRPDVLLMDEPFSAVDAFTRRHLQTELIDIWQKTATAVMFVAHYIDEAVLLADRAILLAGAPARIVEEFHVPVARIERSNPAAIAGIANNIALKLGDAGR